MMLSELLTALETQHALHARRVKDIKTSVRYLAAALGYPSPAQCPVDATALTDATWRPTLEAHFTHLETEGHRVGATTRRNTRTNLRYLFQVADTHGLLSTPLPPLRTPPRRSLTINRHYYDSSPYRLTYAPKSEHRTYALPHAQWPDDIQTGFQAYQKIARRYVSPTTIAAYTKRLSTLFGYVAHVRERTPRWDDVFDQDLLTDFLYWHGARVGRPNLSSHGVQVVIVCATIAKVLKLPCALEMAEFRNSCKLPKALHDKDQHMVPRLVLEQVAEACLAEGRQPFINNDPRTRFSGRNCALRFGKGLMLKWLIRLPMRQRNLREMQLGRHLRKDHAGDWHLRYVGDDLKVKRRGKEDNVYARNLSTFCPDLIPLLEDWLTVYRPRLPQADTSPYVFLTQRGRPYNELNICVELRYEVYSRTGIRWHPHMARDTWATEYIEESHGDLFGAAEALGNTPGQIQKTYVHPDQKLQQAKATAFNVGSLKPKPQQAC
jgi:hypothetical protein